MQVTALEYEYGGAPFTDPGAGALGIAGIAYDANAERRSFAAIRDSFDALFGAP